MSFVPSEAPLATIPPPVAEVTQPRQAPPRKSRWSFSLLTLLLATGLVLAVISHVRTSLLLQNYRENSDELEIESPHRLHVRQMNHSNLVVRRWRAFLPEGRRYCLHTATKGVMDTTLPPPEYSRMFDVHGEVIVEVIALDTMASHHYDRSYIVAIMQEQMGGGNATHLAARVNLAVGNHPAYFDELAKERTLSFAEDQPAVLLRGMSSTWHSGYRRPAHEHGIIVWIEPAPPATH